jgi:electron transfer flavoprotein alpha subunit
MSNILYLAEHRNGIFRKPAFELSSFARALAELSGGTSTALILGQVDADEISRLGRYGTHHILHTQDGPFDSLDNAVWSTALAQAAEKADADIIVLAASLTGKAIAPALAVKLQAGLAPGVTALPSSIKPLVVQRKVFSGKAFADVEIATERKVLTLSPNSFEIREGGGEATMEAWAPVALPSPVAEILDTTKAEGKVLLAEAEIVVSAGRGMKSPENWGPVEELAEVLGAATACSRPASDEGWRPHSEHVGQTGKIIAPNLYFAFGISGAVQHIAGVSGSKVIVAVNKDPEAPIFSVADYGILGDVQQILPGLVEAAKRFKENS